MYLFFEPIWTETNLVFEGKLMSFEIYLLSWSTALIDVEVVVEEFSVCWRDADESDVGYVHFLLTAISFSLAFLSLCGFCAVVWYLNNCFLLSLMRDRYLHFSSWLFTFNISPEDLHCPSNRVYLFNPSRELMRQILGLRFRLNNWEKKKKNQNR